MNRTDKPPIGIIPEELWKEQRLNDLAKAIMRYVKDFREVPPKWISEYNKIINEVMN